MQAELLMIRGQTRRLVSAVRGVSSLLAVHKKKRMQEKQNLKIVSSTLCSS